MLRNLIVEALLRNLIVEALLLLRDDSGAGERGSIELIYQYLVPSRLFGYSSYITLCFAKQTQASPYQATFHDKRDVMSNSCCKYRGVRNREVHLVSSHAEK